MKFKKKNLIDIINKFDWIAAVFFLIVLLFILKDKIMILLDIQISIIDNIISVFGTLFGFVLTCLSIFIIFKTDDKYSIRKQDNKDALGKLLTNDKFNDIYMLFLKNLYSIGMVLLLSFTIYFISTVEVKLKIVFIIIYMFFIGLSIIRTTLSLLAFKKLIEVIIKNK